MELTGREWWTGIHGMVLGAAFLLAFAGGLAEFWGLRSRFLTPEGIRKRLRRLVIGTWGMAIVAWATVITGTWIVYPWYRAEPEGAKFELLANESTAGWHEFGMEWKEHIAWISPLLATVVAVVVSYYGIRLVNNNLIRRALMVTFFAAFATAGIAGLFGALISKAAPVQ